MSIRIAQVFQSILADLLGLCAVHPTVPRQQGEAEGFEAFMHVEPADYTNFSLLLVLSPWTVRPLDDPFLYVHKPCVLHHFRETLGRSGIDSCPGAGRLVKVTPFQEG